MVLGSFLIGLINPVVATVFAGIFTFLWVQERRRRHVLEFAVGYYAYGLSFLFQTFRWPFGDPVNPILANITLAISFLCVIHGMLRRAAVPFPAAPVAVVMVSGFSGMLWFMFVHPDMSGRIFSVSFMFGALLLVAAAELRGKADKKIVDHLVFWTVLMTGLHCFARTLVFSMVEGHIVERAQYIVSMMAVALNFTSAFFSLLIALTLISAIVLDMLEELRQASVTDPLSKLLNRRGFDEQGTEILLRSRRMSVPAAVVICDLDHFKQFNDRFGHACGDRVIAAFAQCLHRAAEKGLAARLGGEEFAVLLAMTDLNGARLFAEQVRTACIGLAVPGLPAGQHVTASFGVAEMRGGEDLSGLLRRADIALLDAKRGGRDRVRTFSNSGRIRPAGEGRPMGKLAMS